MQDRKGERVVAKDETPFTCDIAKIPNLKPAFGKDGHYIFSEDSGVRYWLPGANSLLMLNETPACVLMTLELSPTGCM